MRRPDNDIPLVLQHLGQLPREGQSIGSVNRGGAARAAGTAHLAHLARGGRISEPHGRGGTFLTRRVPTTAAAAGAAGAASGGGTGPADGAGHEGGGLSGDFSL